MTFVECVHASEWRMWCAGSPLRVRIVSLVRYANRVACVLVRCGCLRVVVDVAGVVVVDDDVDVVVVLDDDAVVAVVAVVVVVAIVVAVVYVVVVVVVVVSGGEPE